MEAPASFANYGEAIREQNLKHIHDSIWTLVWPEHGVKKEEEEKRIILRTSFKKLFATVITSPSHTQPEEREESERACVSVCVLTPLFVEH